MQNKLIEEFLERNAKLVNLILDKAIREKQVSASEVKMAKQLSHASNILTAIHLYRMDSDLAVILSQMSMEQRGAIEAKLTTIWSYLRDLSPMQISELASETIMNSSRISEEVYAIYGRV